MNFVILLFTIKIGLIPSYEGIVEQNENNPIQMTPSYFTELEAEAVLWNHVFIGGSVYTHMYLGKEKGLTLSPDEALYGFWFGLYFYPLEVKYTHYCSHTVGPWIYPPNPRKVFTLDTVTLSLSNRRLHE